MLMNHLRVYLRKEWFVMKHIKMKNNNWLSPEEVDTKDGKNF